MQYTLGCDVIFGGDIDLTVVSRGIKSNTFSKYSFPNLISFANDYVGQQSGDWIGGGREGESSKSMPNEVFELGKALRPYLRNPTISNLYLLVIDSHEKMVGKTASNLNQSLTRNASDWDTFSLFSTKCCL
ncbi:hypothetical protein ACH5RR_014312 [Cinchona calisaya]|uniref:Uncharacterized protein n=1 Tax=Cinchona calisaya TaxID=153742 RepID=A0ABD3A5X5_9GENT